MKITQARNATLKLEYAGVRFLIDPMLAEQGAYPGFPSSANSHLSNPTVPLGLPLEELLDVDAVVVTHLHLDHWDDAAKREIPKALPVFAQNEADAAAIRGAGFSDVRVLGEASAFEGVSLRRTGGQHGTDAAYRVIGDRLGEVSGVVFRHPEEKTLYVAGDTIWNDHVAAALAEHAPDVVVLNCGEARILPVGAIIMGVSDVLETHRAAPGSMLVASHMEAVNHCLLSRKGLLGFAEAEGFADRLRVPQDGETLSF